MPNELKDVVQLSDREEEERDKFAQYSFLVLSNVADFTKKDVYFKEIGSILPNSVDLQYYHVSGTKCFHKLYKVLQDNAVPTDYCNLERYCLTLFLKMRVS